ncbi:MAG TPA: response regulator [Patescibacteria group bacterium]|jgi:DNA-binding response OmpR family regulator
MAGPKKILLIEDDFLLLEMYAITLSGEGYEVYKASDGRQGLDLIQKERPDLILLDLSMPSISGFQVLDDLKESGDDTPVIVISNTDERAAMDKCKELGVKEYVVKARTNLDQIKDIVKRYL